MTSVPLRRLRRLLAAAVAVLMLAPLAARANAVSDIDPDARTSLVVHAFEQPHRLGAPTDGSPLGPDLTDGLVPVAGAAFAATPVPGVDLTTDGGWAAARDLTVPRAAELVAGTRPAAHGVTARDGGVELAPLEVGLYYVEQVSVPDGVVPAAAFLVTLPAPDPEGTGWLYTVHAYPKNATVGVDFSVDEAVTCAAEVTWTSRTAIPRLTAIDGYTVRNLLAPKARLIGSAADVRVALTTPGRELAPEDYLVRLRTENGRAVIEVDVTPSGLAKLAAAREADPDAEVAVSYRTTLDAVGIHQADAELLVPGAAPVTGQAATSLVDCPTPTPSPSPSPSPSPTPTPTPTPGPGRKPGLPGTGAQIGGFSLLAIAFVAAAVLLPARQRSEGRPE